MGNSERMSSNALHQGRHLCQLKVESCPDTPCRDKKDTRSSRLQAKMLQASMAADHHGVQESMQLVTTQCWNGACSSLRH